MDEIQQRLHDTSERCYKSYEAWRGDEKNPKIRQELREAVHELRRVASRLEIELAVSESNQGSQRQIPIPPHRDAQKRGKKEDENDNKGNEHPDLMASLKNNKGPKGAGSRRRRPQDKKAAGGEE